MDSQSLAAGAKVMQWLKALEDNRDLINIGAYAAGSDPLVDQALRKFKEMREFLQQDIHEYAPLKESLASLQKLTAGEAA